MCVCRASLGLSTRKVWVMSHGATVPRPPLVLSAARARPHVMLQAAVDPHVDSHDTGVCRFLLTRCTIIEHVIPGWPMQ